MAWIKSCRPSGACRTTACTARFFWIVVLATTIGLRLSFTRARKLEGAGASKIGTVMLYVLIATIGMQMDLEALARQAVAVRCWADLDLVHAG